METVSTQLSQPTRDAAYTQTAEHVVLPHQVTSSVKEHLDALQSSISEMLIEEASTPNSAQITNLTTQGVKQVLSTLVSHDLLSEASAQTITRNLRTVTALPPVLQLSTVKEVFTQAQHEIGALLNSKTLSSTQVSAVKSSLNKIKHAEETLNNLSMVNPTNTMLGATLGDTPPPPTDIVFATTTAPSSGAPNIGSMDGPTAAMFVMLWMAEQPISNQMNTNSQQIVALGNEANVVSSTANQLKDILGFMSSNANATVNVFYAFYDWMQNNPQLANSPLLGTLKSGVVTTDSVDEQFANSNNALFTSMYKTLQQMDATFSSEGLGTITAASLAQGDTAAFVPGTDSLSTTTIATSPQQIFMTYWTQPANAASTAISGLTADNSNAIFQSMWTNFAAEQQSSSQNLYVPASFQGYPQPYYQLTFTADNVSTVIGSNSAQEDGGALQTCTQAQTTSNTTNSALMATQTYLGNQFSNAINTGITILSDLKFNF